MKHNRSNQLKLSQLRILIAAAEYSSFSEAALQLGMSQSAVSNAIAVLEADLGVVLFSRGRYGAHLTPIGERVISHAQQMMQLQEEIFKDANLARSLQGGQVRISAFRTVSTHILPEVMAQFRQRFPDITLSIIERFDSPSVEEDLRKGRAEIGFADYSMSDEFETWELLRDECLVLFPPNFKLIGSELSWEQLCNYPLIMGPDGDSCDQQVYAHCAALGKSLQVAYQFKADSTIVSMVAQGLGATIIPRLAANPIPDNVQVYSLPVPFFRIIRVATLAGALLPPGVFAFLDLLRNTGKLTKI
ncbi:LysR family transcriptional regulator [Leptolyngbya sp. FACHB-261]|uniref:LysR family transcriptional regulator n=1 Tax=Leptolyngbya sp. FACHB-261 TaxID=2692806 RepID=UPI0016830356|nr:LysR family transcriptional regulator [Leptolyngbya sp. FACHB-261]MBD2103532.1 LysR family transcriptional regulator [Leptolyngbya sp. FACHB-261]